MAITVSSLRTTESLWPNAIRSRVSQNRPFAVVVSPHGVLESIGFSDLENASNRAAWFLDQECAEDDTFFYMGPSDIRYMVWALAAMKTGKCVVFPSPGNSVPANRKLFETVGAKKFLFAAEIGSMSKPLQEATQGIIKSQAAPNYTELMQREETALAYPFAKTWDDVKLTRFMALHTSGTSGHPKPIYWNHLAASVLGSFLDDAFVGPNGTNLSRDLFSGTTMLMPFPLFHMAGMASVLISVLSDTTIVLPKSGTPLSPPNYVAMLKQASCTATFAPPAVLEALMGYPSGLNVLAQLEHVAYAGGPLQPARGAELAKHVKHLFPILASTEGGAAILESTGDSSCWDSFKFINVGQRMEEMTPGYYELVFPRTERAEQTYGFFHVFPDLNKEYRTSDLLSPVAGQEGRWVFRGRSDNWVVMTNGLKMDPIDIENTVGSHPKVKGVLVAGSHRFRLCMLVELKDFDCNVEEVAIVEEIWPLLEQANKNAPKFGRVPKELIIIASPDKPFLRASKATIQRQLTIAAYKEEIDNLYYRVENGLLSSGLLPILSTKPDGLIPFLIDLHQQTLDLGDKTLTLEDDLIDLGLDSLTMFILLARLKAALRQFGIKHDQLEHITPKLLYSTTTIRRMAGALSALLEDSSSLNGSNNSKDFEDLLAKYTPVVKALVGEINKPPVQGLYQVPEKEHTVVLTGSTGSLGSYILASLLSKSSTKKVICLNRDVAKAARAKQEKSFASRGLPPLSNNEGRVVFLQAKLAEPNLGLSSDAYSDLVRDATCIIHNAYPVNWLMGVTSFEPQIAGIIHLLELVKSSGKHLDLLFVSSIAAATPVVFSPDIPDKILETVIRPEVAPKVLLRQGYAQSKYICEHLLQEFSLTLDSPKNIRVLRVGQICGPVDSNPNNAWNPSEWFPSLVISSVKFVGAVPDTLGASMNENVNWVPVDKLAEVICELMPPPEKSTQGSFTVYNIVNPQPTSWPRLLPGLDRIVSQRIPAVAWVTRIEGVGGKDDELYNLHRNPALKLLDFYKQTLVDGNGKEVHEAIDTSNLLQASPTARSLGPITQENLASWAESWGL